MSKEVKEESRMMIENSAFLLLTYFEIPCSTFLVQYSCIPSLFLVHLFICSSRQLINSKLNTMDINDVFGSGQELTPLQMSVRAFVMFFITLALIRFGGLRIFGKKTAFDNVLVIMLGAVLARGVVGASPFLSTIAGGAVMVIIHRILGWLAMKYTWVGKIVKGIHRSLYKNGEFNLKNMQMTQISKDDLKEGLRLEINSDNFDNVKEALIEKNGQISIVKR